MNPLLVPLFDLHQNLSGQPPKFVVQRQMQRQAELDSLQAQLDGAKWNLDKTVVSAPSEGFVTNLTLRKGARVVAFPVAPVMAFIETDETLAGVQINQIFARYIAPGQPVELAFKFLPGKIYTGHVVALLQATPPGQLQVSGRAASPVIQAAPFAVRIEIDDPTLAAQLPAGTVGEAAIYTETVKATHIIRRVMIRMTTYLDYVLPF